MSVVVCVCVCVWHRGPLRVPSGIAVHVARPCFFFIVPMRGSPLTRGIGCHEPPVLRGTRWRAVLFRTRSLFAKRKSSRIVIIMSSSPVLVVKVELPAPHRRWRGQPLFVRRVLSGDLTLERLHALLSTVAPGQSWLYIDADGDKCALEVPEDLEAALVSMANTHGELHVITRSANQFGGVQKALSKVPFVYVMGAAVFGLCFAPMMTMLLAGIYCYATARQGGGCSSVVASACAPPAAKSPKPTAPPSAVPPHMYATHLETLRSLGFTDVVLNLQTLQRCNGDIPSAVTALLEAQGK